MGQFAAVLFCCSPLLFLAAGYYLGRFGSPIVLKRQPRRDRRRTEPATIEADSEVETYTP